MAELVRLNNDAHGELKVERGATIAIAAAQHIMGVRITEISQAVCSFPVFLTKLSNSGDWALSAITSVEPGKNLFVQNMEWQAAYQPTGMQTYPLYLMQADDNEKGYAVGIDKDSDALSSSDGEALFDENGKESLYVGRVTALLEANLKNDFLTHKFIEKMQALDLIKPIEVLIHYADGAVNTLQGLNTLDEDKLQALDSVEIEELHGQGYLTAINALMISLHQLNALIQRHNLTEGSDQIKQIKLQLPREDSAG